MATESYQSKIVSSPPSLTKALREAVKRPGRKGTWLQHLSDNQLLEVYWRLKNGQAAQAITKIAQVDWGIQRKSSPKSLARSVLDFRDRVLGDIEISDMRTNEGASQAKALVKKAKFVAEKVDGIKRMEWLIEVQSERVMMLFEREKQSLPFKHTDHTVEVLCKMIYQYETLKMQLGIQPTIPQEYNVHVTHTWNKVVSGIGDESVKSADALTRFLQWADKNAVTMKLDHESGTYIPVGKQEDGEPQQTE